MILYTKFEVCGIYSCASHVLRFFLAGFLCDFVVGLLRVFVVSVAQFCYVFRALWLCVFLCVFALIARDYVSAY